MDEGFVPGALVRLPGQPDWGLGQVQSAVGTRVTVNFEHAGKRLVNIAAVTLEIVDPDDSDLDRRP
ncbi:MAG TPA: DUF3553 domain-containing protein [Azospirillaceae bacterium]|nr:DUF3553 domain-containing protein [Azospirillaceae bacterium]